MTADAAGGVWTYAIDLARGLRARGIEIVIAGMGPRPKELVPDIDIFWGDYKLEWQDDPWVDIDRASEWLLFLERKLEPNLIHLNGYCHAALPWRAPTLVVAHSCVLSWWQAVHGAPAPPEWDEYRTRVRSGIHAADFVVAPSKAMLMAVETHYGQPKNSAVISNGRDPAAFHAMPKEDFILTAGRLWDQAKNLAALDRAAASVRWPVYAAGDGKIGGNIRGLGQLPPAELHDWFGRASIYALPARYEPFGLSILEAALSGCALVLGDIASLRENWQDAAIFIPPGDDAALAEALNSLINHEMKLGEVQSKARERASRFTLERMVHQYEACYAALLRRSHPATAFKS